MNAMRKTGLHCAGLHSKSESQSFCCSTALQHQVLLKMSAMWKLEFSGLKCTLVQVKVKVFAAANTEDECTVTAGNRCNSVRMAFVQWLRSHRFAHFNYCSTIASLISTIAQLLPLSISAIALRLSQSEQACLRLWCLRLWCYQYYWYQIKIQALLQPLFLRLWIVSKDEYHW